MHNNKRARMEEQNYLLKNQSHFANQNNMRLTGLLCDVTIKVNDREFQAHKNILAANLKYFRLMFLNSFQESSQEVVTMQDVNATDLEAFITYAYIGRILLTEDNALGFLKVANYLSEDDIKEACIVFLQNHLKAEEACQAYHFADAIECPSLRNVAKQSILLHFQRCSQTAEYFDLDCESLKKILFNVNSASESQQCFFEGIMRWILHNVKSRQVYMNDLLNLIDMTELTSDYLIEYFCEIIKDQGDIVKDIMFFYRRKVQELKQSENGRQSLMIVGTADEKLCIQFYDFSEKKWCRLSQVADLNRRMIGSWTILNRSFHYTSHKYGNSKAYNLHVFDFSKKQNTMLASESRLLKFDAMSACTKMVYFCGGERKQNESSSDQVLKYDPLRKSFKTLNPMETTRDSAASIFYQGFLHVLGGIEDSAVLDSVEKYDLETKTWLPFPSMNRSRYGFGVAVLDGKLYACGGSISKTIEVYDPLANSWQLKASMNKSRFGFFLVPHDGKLLAVGGDFEKTIEVYDPSKDQWQIDNDLSSGLQIKHPAGGLVPSSFAKSYSS